MGVGAVTFAIAGVVFALSPGEPSAFKACNITYSSSDTDAARGIRSGLERRYPHGTREYLGAPIVFYLLSAPRHSTLSVAEGAESKLHPSRPSRSATLDRPRSSPILAARVCTAKGRPHGGFAKAPQKAGRRLLFRPSGPRNRSCAGRDRAARYVRKSPLRRDRICADAPTACAANIEMRPRTELPRAPNSFGRLHLIRTMPTPRLESAFTTIT